MRTIIFIGASCALVISITLSGCNGKFKDLQFVEQDIDSTITKSGGAQKAAWKQIFRESGKSDWIKRADYMGPTSTLYLGSLKTDNDNLGTELFDLSESDKKLLFAKGADQSASTLKKYTFDLNTILGADLNFTNTKLSELNGELNATISTSKEMNLAFTWAVDNLRTDELRYILRKRMDQDRWAFYYESMTLPGREIVTKAIRVSKFRGDILLSSSLSTKLAGQLAGGQTAKLANGLANISLKSTADKKISIESSPEAFYVFVVWSAAKKM